jgi:L-asparaginase II
MRLLTILTLLVLVAGGLGMALAQPGATSGGAAGAANDRPCAPATGAASNATFAQWRLACVRNMTELRRASMESFLENRTLALARHEANLSHVRATFEDGKVAALTDCLAQAAPFGRNASGPHGGVLAGCMKDKMKPLRDAAQASHKAERQTITDALQAARERAKAQFRADEQAWLAANPRP